MKDFFAVDGLFAVIMNLIGEWIVLSVFWVLFSLPIVTAGAAATAAYVTATTVIRGKEGHVVPVFIKTFRAHFGRTALFTLGYLVLFAIITVDGFFFYANREVFQTTLYFYLLLFSGLFLIGNAVCLFPCTARYPIRKRSLLKLSVIMQFRYLPITAAAVIVIFSCLFVLWFQPWGLLILPGMMMYLFSFPMEWILKHYVASDHTKNGERCES